MKNGKNTIKTRVRFMEQKFLDGYLQALLDVEEKTRFGAKYQQYYRIITNRTTDRLRGLVMEEVRK